MEIVYELCAGHSGRIHGFIMMRRNNILLLLLQYMKLKYYSFGIPLEFLLSSSTVRESTERYHTGMKLLILLYES